MRPPIYVTTIVLHVPSVDDSALSTTFASSVEPDLDDLTNAARSRGYEPEISMTKHELYVADDPTRSWIDAQSLAEDVNPKEVVPVDAVAARMNEIEHSNRETKREVQSMRKAIEQLVTIVGMIAQPQPEGVGAKQWNDHVAAGALSKSEPKKPTGGSMRRSDRRDRPEEFQGGDDPLSNTMGLRGTSASPMLGPDGRVSSRSATQILTAVIGEDGNPTVVAEEPTRVGDTLTRGTR